MRYTVTSFLVIVALCLLPSPVPAQQGPEIPCVDCPPLQSIKPYPLSGNWHNPEHFGGGFMFEIQNGRLGGIFHHYNQDGDPTWAVIIGTLQSGEDEVLWKLETELGMVEGGPCIGCPNLPPQPAGTAGTIRLEFLHRNYGRFQVDDGEWQNIVPFLFGIGGQARFAPYSDQIFPDLEQLAHPLIVPDLIVLMDTWILSFRFPSGTSFGFETAYVNFGPAQPLENGFRHSLGLTLSDVAASLGELICTAASDSGPVCHLEVFDNSIVQQMLPEFIRNQSYVIHPGNFGHKRFDGESENGLITLRAFRLDYD